VFVDRPPSVNSAPCHAPGKTVGTDGTQAVQAALLPDRSCQEPTPISQWRRLFAVGRRMKIRGALCIAIVVISVAVFPASLRADSLPAPPASSEAPGLVVDPTVMRADPAISWDPTSRVYRMFTSETWFAFVPEWESPKVTGPWHYVGDALPVLPTWHGHLFSTWAPEVEDVDGVWTLWAEHRGHRLSPGNCLSVPGNGQNGGRSVHC
jgi:hypothetical protein